MENKFFFQDNIVFYVVNRFWKKKRFGENEMEVLRRVVMFFVSGFRGAEDRWSCFSF